MLTHVNVTADATHPGGLGSYRWDDEGVVPPDPFASGGRGLFLMRQMVDHCTIESGSLGTVIVLRRNAFDEPPLPAHPEEVAESER